MGLARHGRTATLLVNGKVLMVGGGVLTELYDPTTGTCAATGAMAAQGEFHTATLLTGGMVLMVGGDIVGLAHASAELY